MADFRIGIAGKVFGVRSLFDSSRDYCRFYLTEKEPDFRVEVSPEDLRFEQAYLDEEAALEGFRPRIFTDPFLDRAAIQRKVAEHLFHRGTLLIHGSAVALDGQGYLFTARSGTGKSTHTRLWREAFGSRAVTVNDDKPFIRLDGETPLLCGAPWSGKHGLDTNITVPLAGICILERGTENRILRIQPREALPMLLHQANAPLDPALLPQHRTLVETLAQQVPLWRMECTREPSAAQVAFEAMGQGKAP